MGGFFGGGTASMVGATASVAGSGGSVPAPVAGQEGLFLRGDATFANCLGLKQLDFVNATQKGFNLSPLLGEISASIPMTANIIYLVPFYIPNYTYTAIIHRRSSGTTGAAQTIRMGVYNCNPKTMEPTTLVFNTAETNVFSLSTDLSITISQQLSGLYYTAIVTANIGSGTFSSTGINRGSTSTPYYITESAQSDYRKVPGLTYTHTGTSAAMPSDLTGATFGFNGTANGCAFATLRV